MAQMVLAVGPFAAPGPDVRRTGTIAAAAAAEEAREAAKDDADGNARFHQYLDNAAESTAQLDARACCPPCYADNELRGGFVAASTLKSFEAYLGRPFPYPGGLTFVRSPRRCRSRWTCGCPRCWARASILSTDRLGPPRRRTSSPLDGVAGAHEAALGGSE